jgi:crotonobetainyl-CoA:carnitine CoA-transferase CaiB-like acyl-CoA transferase
MFPILKGIRILDLTAVILGPYGAQILGDLGAEIIKIEGPEGDSMRDIAPTAAPGMSAIFANNNRNKSSVALDLKSPGGKRALEKLIPTADVRALHPKLIYCAAVGFGRNGPYAGRPAYDDVIQAASGFAGLFAARDGTPLYAPSIIADKVTGLHLVYAVLAALLHRERSGEVPGYVEIPMFEAMTAFNLNEHLSGATWGDDTTAGYQRMLARDRRPLQTKDGWLGALPYTAAHWSKFFAEIGRAHLSKEAWFTNATERSRNFEKLYGTLAEVLPSRTTAEWIVIFKRLDIPHSVINTPSDLLRDPHLSAVDFFTPNYASESPVKRTLRQPISFGDLEKSPDLPPPILGADTDRILRAAGLSDAEIKAVKRS